jgi:hypothetical protein
VRVTTSGAGVDRSGARGRVIRGRSRIPRTAEFGAALGVHRVAALGVHRVAKPAAALG